MFLVKDLWNCSHGLDFPEGAINLNVDTNIFESNYVQVDRGFALIASVLPGSHEITYSYEIPYENSNFKYIKLEIWC